MKRIAFAPATVANVAVGFDILGFALEGLGEVAIVEKTGAIGKITLNPVKGFPDLPTDPEKNTATAGLLRLLQEKKLPFGLRVTLKKNIPIGSGLGGSAASAVAALIATNALLEKKLTPAELLDFALTGEEVASHARHADNIAPCLVGGLVFTGAPGEYAAHKIPTPRSLRCIVLLPELSIHTANSRKALNPVVSLPSMIEQSACLTGFILGCMNSDFALIRRSLRDVVIEPQRAAQIPGFFDLQKAALAAGALGCSLSGSGPAIFALAQGNAVAEKVQRALRASAKKRGLGIKGTWTSPIGQRGAYIMKGN